VNARLAPARFAAEERPGRSCPVEYRYPPSSLDRDPDLEAETLYVAGGLYGNVGALERLLEIVAAEPGAVLAFNGDFHWFDVDAADFNRIALGVAPHHAIRGNVETEIAGEDRGAGCGCAYPMDVSDEDVERSNAILARLRETARGLSGERERLAAMPMNLVARVGRARVAIVHGDAASLAGWGFAHDRLDDPGHGRWIDSMFEVAHVDVFACTHTCLAAYRRFGRGVVANNGAAGMPNFAGTRFGLATRISTRRETPIGARFGLEAAGVRIDALALHYDAARFERRFLAAWPEGSPAHASYFRRLREGPRHDESRARPA
jgi:hypothetical protein